MTMPATLKQLVADEPVLKQKLHTTRSVLASCKNWLDQLPENAGLEPVDVKVDGHDLDDVRAQLKVRHAELRPCAPCPHRPPTSSSASRATSPWRGRPSAAS
jgi:hypothetical protein